MLVFYLNMKYEKHLNWRLLAYLKIVGKMYLASPPTALPSKVEQHCYHSYWYNNTGDLNFEKSFILTSTWSVIKHHNWKHLCMFLKISIIGWFINLIVSITGSAKDLAANTFLFDFHIGQTPQKLLRSSLKNVTKTWSCPPVLKMAQSIGLNVFPSLHFQWGA